MPSFRRTPARAMVAQHAFLDEAKKLLPHIFKDEQTPVVSVADWDIILESDVEKQASAASLVAGKLACLFGAHVAPRILRESSYDPQFLEWERAQQALVQEVHRAEMRARARASRYQFLAAYKPMSGHLPEGYGFDGEISKQLAAVLVARRKAWETVGTPLTGEEWRTIDLASPKVALALPLGGYKIFREVFMPDDVRGDFSGCIVLDERLASRGGLFKIGSEEQGKLHLVGLDKTVGLYVIARAVIRELGRFCAGEVLRRLREGVKPTFAMSLAGRRRSYHRNTTPARVSISAGRRDREKARAWSDRATRYLALAELHHAAVERISEQGREWARTWAGEPDVAAREIKSRYARAAAEFASARDRYNQRALKFCIKKSLDGVPFAVPPARFPARRASLCKGDMGYICTAERDFSEKWDELVTARDAMKQAGQATPPVPVAEPMPALDGGQRPAAQLDFGLVTPFRRAPFIQCDKPRDTHCEAIPVHQAELILV